MSKLNVYQLKRPERLVETKTFTENGVELILTLQEPDAADLSRISEETERLVIDYLTGNEERPAAPFPYDGIKLSRTLLMNAAAVAECQVTEEWTERYSPEEFVIMSVSLPVTWIEIQRWVGQLSKKWQSDPGK